MSKDKFKVGDKVRATRSVDRNKSIIGLTGKIISLRYDSRRYGVEFDKKIHAGHDSGETGKDGYCWNCPEDALELVNRNECIVIYRKGNETIALDKRTGEKGIAKCSPEDEFDFEIGAKLAFERLFATEKDETTKDENIKVGDTVKCISTGSTYSTYEAWAGLGIYKQNFVKGATPMFDSEYEVINIAPHEFGHLIALIQDKRTTQVFIIGLYGIEKV